MKMKKVLALGLIAMMAAATFAGCGSKGGDSASTDGAADGSKGQVYYLNFKPEADEAWQDIAKQYTEETGVPVTVITAASGTYEETLSSEIIKDEAPTLFQVNGPVGLANWKDYCYDLKGTSLYDELTMPPELRKAHQARTRQVEGTFPMSYQDVLRTLS